MNVKTGRDPALGTAPVGKLFWKLALPAIAAQLVNVLYNIVDRIYIGHIPVYGAAALTGVGVTMPAIMIISAFAALVSAGGAPRVSMLMGKGAPDSAERIIGTCTFTLCAISLALTLIMQLFAVPILRLFGASDATLPYALEYISIYSLGTIFVQLSLGLNAFITAQGFSTTSMLTVTIGAALNIVLDPLFIFVFDMGVAGAAVATVLSQLASCVYVLCVLFGRTVPVRIGFGRYSLRLVGRILVTGISPFLIIFVDSIMIISMNAVLQSYGGPELCDRLITCATIAQSFMLVVTMPLGGISGGTQTILAFNFGAHRRDRILEAQKHITLLCVGYTAIMFALARLAGGLFVRLFTGEADLAAEALSAIRVCTLAVIPLGVQYAIVDGFTGMAQVKLALPLSAFRKIVYFAALFALPAAFGARAAFWAEPVSDIIGPIASVAVYAIFIRKILTFPAAPAHHRDG